MSQNHSAEWLRAKIEALEELELLTGFGTAWAENTRKACQLRVDERLSEYRALLAAAEAREAAQPSAAEVIAAAEKAISDLLGATHTIEVLGEYEALDINTSSRKKMRARVDGIEGECREALSMIAKWNEGHNA